MILLAENIISFYSLFPQLARNKTNVIIDGGSKKQLMTAVPTKKSENETPIHFFREGKT